MARDGSDAPAANGVRGNGSSGARGPPPAQAPSTSSATAIAAVDGIARQLYRRARTAGPEFAEIATEVRGLHTALKHLRVEAEDRDSLLCRDASAGDDSSLYARQLMPMVDDCKFTLQQLDTILEKYGGTSGAESAEEAAPRELESRERDMIARIRSKVGARRADIDIFLDTVQLHNPAKTRQALDNTDEHQLDAIKDKVDSIAARLFRRRRSGGNSENDEDLWLQFCYELESEGFSSEVLRKNKEVLRAYIRGLESHGYFESGNPPSVRGLLHQPHHSQDQHQLPRPQMIQDPPPMTITPASYPGPGTGTRPGAAMATAYDAHSWNSSQQLQPHVSGSYQPPALYPRGSSGLSYDRYTSSSDEDSSDSAGRTPDLALISTRDLLALDQREAELMASRMASVRLSPSQQLPAPPNRSFSPGTSPSGRYLLAAPQPIPIAGGPVSAPTSGPAPPLDHQLSSSPGSQQLLGLSPRYVPPVLIPGYGGPAGPNPPGYSPTSSSIMSPPPAYGASPTMPPTYLQPTNSGSAALTGPTSSALARPFSRLAPDSTGQDIPLDATWTKIRRTLVSPEVLEGAGVRYEARPDFVAVLGVLSREQIAEYARQSEVVRRTRARASGATQKSSPGRRRRRRHADGRRHLSADKRGDEKRHYSDKDSGAEESDVLWDESDTSDSDEGGRRKGRRASERVSSAARDKYTPKTYIVDEKAAWRDGDGQGTKVYPVIVNPPGTGPNGESIASPSSTVLPKPILKNRNENHVHFDEKGALREISQEELRREQDRAKRRRDRDRDRPKERDKDRDHHGHKRHGSHSQRDRDRDGRREDRAIKKSVWGETLGAVGIGGAAASLLSVLTEAAVGF